VEYISVAEARKMGGLRLVLGVGAPGPWSLSARALFTIRAVPFIAVGQQLGGANEELVDWTGRRNAPVAVFEDEPAIDGWQQILELAERLGRGPSLYPDDELDRALALGLSAEICGEGGLGWSRRLMMLGASRPAADGAPSMIHRLYGARADAVDAAPARVAMILEGLARQLHRQQARGSDYLVADRISLCDVHWACFSILLKRLSEEACPQAAKRPDVFDTLPEAIRAAADPILFAHRDLVWARHIGLPLVY
jgi:glutathione S-transferase